MSDDLKVVELRPMVQTDEALIYNTWLEDNLSAHHVTFFDDKRDKRIKKQVHVAMMKPALYFREQRAVIDKIMKKSKVLIACNAEDTNQIFGYVVYRFLGVEIGIISYIYVRPVYRKFGICNKLMSSLGTMDVITHLQPKSRWFLDRYNVVFNPYMEAYND